MIVAHGLTMGHGKEFGVASVRPYKGLGVRRGDGRRRPLGRGLHDGQQLLAGVSAIEPITDIITVLLSAWWEAWERNEFDREASGATGLRDGLGMGGTGLIIVRQDPDLLDPGRFQLRREVVGPLRGPARVRGRGESETLESLHVLFAFDNVYSSLPL